MDLGYNSRTSQTRQLFIGAVLVVIVTFLVFCQVVSFSFLNFDDDMNLQKNIRFNPLTKASVLQMWQEPKYHMYIPVTYTVWAMDAHLSRTFFQKGNKNADCFNAKVFHLTNLFFHTACAVLVYFFLYFLFQREASPLIGACMGALVFAIHPLQVESVAWITSLKGVLSGFWTMGALLLFLIAFKKEGRVKALYLGVSTLCFFLGLLSKPTAFIFPIAAFVVSYIKKEDTDWKAAKNWWGLWAFIMFVTVCGSYFIYDSSVMRYPFSLYERLLIASDAFTFYLSKVFVPNMLSLDYGRRPFIALGFSTIYLRVFFVFALVAFTVKKTRHVLTIALVIFALGLAPVLGFFHHDQQFFSNVSDRYVYFSMLGPALVVAWCLCRWGKYKGPLFVVGAAVTVLAYLSYEQTKVWKNNETLYAHTLLLNPKSWVSEINWGETLLDRNDIDGAAFHLGRSIELSQSFEACDKLTEAFDKAPRNKAVRDVIDHVRANPPRFAPRLFSCYEKLWKRLGSNAAD